MRRAAAFLWMMPFDAALSSFRWAIRSASTESSVPAELRCRLDARLQLGANGLVPLGGFGVGEDALLLALDVGHGGGVLFCNRQML